MYSNSWLLILVFNWYLTFLKIKLLIQCSPLKRPSVKRPSRLIDQFSLIPKDQFGIKFARINGQKNGWTNDGRLNGEHCISKFLLQKNFGFNEYLGLKKIISNR